jgi:hypothetical protein
MALKQSKLIIALERPSLSCPMLSTRHLTWISDEGQIDKIAYRRTLLFLSVCYRIVQDKK